MTILYVYANFCHTLNYQWPARIFGGYGEVPY
jgi:hypothetical protein